MVDISVVAKDGRSVNCHKIVAAALSPLMREFFVDSSCDQIILPDFGLAEIYALMNFIYTGQ